PFLRDRRERSDRPDRSGGDRSGGDRPERGDRDRRPRGASGDDDRNDRNDRDRDREPRGSDLEDLDEQAIAAGVLEITGEGFGFLRHHNFAANGEDIYVSQTQ